MRPALRFILALGMGALLVLPASMLQAQSNGRETGRCLRACLSNRLACWRNCPVTCTQMHPTNIEERLRCIDFCQLECLRVETECQNICNQPPITPEVP